MMAESSRSSTNGTNSNKEDYDSSASDTDKVTEHGIPTQVCDKQWVWKRLKDNTGMKTLGKWLVFKHYDEIDKAWADISDAIARNELGGCVTAKCSTMMYNPTENGPGPQTRAVICVYTKEHNMDAIGFKLIELVKQDIKYKTDADTLSFKYTFVGSGKTTIKTIYWNEGNPSVDCTGPMQMLYGTSRDKEDIWHLNEVKASNTSEDIGGFWILTLQYEELTDLWHLLKNIIEYDANCGIIKMVCPAKEKRNSPSEAPLFLIYTSIRQRKQVGKCLINIVKRDIEYEFEDKSSVWRREQSETLYWNNGEPDYSLSNRKGITKNWRTGEDL